MRQTWSDYVDKNTDEEVVDYKYKTELVDAWLDNREASWAENIKRLNLQAAARSQSQIRETSMQIKDILNQAVKKMH